MREPNQTNPLLERIEQIKNEIADVLLEIDNIKLQVNPQIEADYMAKIGCWENELLRAQIEACRMRRKCELAQAAVNRREQVDVALFEGILEREFEEWQEQLNARVGELRAALERRSAFVALSAESAKELKSLHRKLVKRLHPDLHPISTITFWATRRSGWEAALRRRMAANATSRSRCACTKRLCCISVASLMKEIGSMRRALPVLVMAWLV